MGGACDHCLAGGIKTGVRSAVPADFQIRYFLKNHLSADSVAPLLRRLLREAGLEDAWTSPHGLRSGFLTQAALDVAPLQTATNLSVHRSQMQMQVQVQRYYADIELG